MKELIMCDAARFDNSTGGTYVCVRDNTRKMGHMYLQSSWSGENMTKGFSATSLNLQQATKLRDAINEFIEEQSKQKVKSRAKEILEELYKDPDLMEIVQKDLEMPF